MNQGGRKIKERIEIFLNGPKSKMILIAFAGYTIGYMMHGLKVWIHLVK